MANVRVAINGFGRIGRLAFRQMFGAKGYTVVAINDLTKPSMLAHLLKYDSTQGRYALGDTVSANDEEGTITVNGKTIKIYSEKDAANCPWKKLKVDVVLECTGFYTDIADANKQHSGRRTGRWLFPLPRPTKRIRSTSPCPRPSCTR